MAEHRHVDETLNKQIEVCMQIFKLFREAAIIMDEVDLILHPLKSELNFPIGERHELDFTNCTCVQYATGWC